MTVYDRDNGKTVTVRSGLILTVKLAVPKGATYGWEVSYLNLGKLRQFKRVTFESKDPCLDFQVFQFRAVGSEETTLRLKYTRPPGEYNPPLRRFCLIIDIG